MMHVTKMNKGTAVTGQIDCDRKGHSRGTIMSKCRYRYTYVTLALSLFCSLGTQIVGAEQTIAELLGVKEGLPTGETRSTISDLELQANPTIPPQLHLERVVLVGRTSWLEHLDKRDLSAYVQEIFPDVRELGTDGGRMIFLRELGRFLHSHYEDMLTCFPSSDSTPLEILMDPEALWDERAALYLTRGLLPGCEAIVKIADGLHSEKEKNLLRRMESDTEDNQRSAHGCEKPPNLYFHQAEAVYQQYGEALAALALATGVPLDDPAKSIMQIQNDLTRRRIWRPFDGPAAAAAEMTEGLLGQVIAKSNIDWTTLSTTEEVLTLLDRLLPLQQKMRELTGINRGAEVYGSELLMHISISILQKSLPQPEAVELPLATQDKRMIMHLTHSSNVEFLRHLLQLEWQSSYGWPANYVAPGDMLGFELYGKPERDGQRVKYNDTSGWYVRVVKLSTSLLQQQKGGTPGGWDGVQDPPELVAVRMAWCTTDDPFNIFCPLSSFISYVNDHIKKGCVLDPQLKHIYEMHWNIATYATSLRRDNDRIANLMENSEPRFRRAGAPHYWNGEDLDGSVAVTERSQGEGGALSGDWEDFWLILVALCVAFLFVVYCCSSFLRFSSRNAQD